jgi:hypothetical protein
VVLVVALGCCCWVMQVPQTQLLLPPLPAPAQLHQRQQQALRSLHRLRLPLLPPVHRCCLAAQELAGLLHLPHSGPPLGLLPLPPLLHSTQLASLL